MNRDEVVDKRVKNAISNAFSCGYQIDNESLTLLKELALDDNIEEIIYKVINNLSKLSDKPLFINKEMIESVISTHYKEKNETFSFNNIESSGVSFKPISKEISSDLKILFDPTEQINSTGNMSDLKNYFQNRFNKIEKLLRERLDVKKAISIREALNTPLNSKIKVIGIITRKREIRERIFIEIEDFEAVATIIVSSRSNKRVHEKATRLLLDQVICVEGFRGKNDLIIAQNFFNPDIPDRKPNTANKEIYAVLLSDLHIGSKTFQKKSFEKFIRWLKGHEGNSNQRSLASKVKYIVIAGDIVDGIGVYPNQEDELKITDIYKQYELAAKIIQKIPEYIEVIIIPGNHDATRQALPQPSISKEYAEAIYEGRRVVMLGDPSKISIMGVEFLLYHGRSLDDIISYVPDVMYRNLNQSVTKSMKYLLKARHLAPIYGNKTPIAPEKQDQLVIDSIPDVFHTGHLHVLGYETYRGTLLINSGSWQSQTPFQEKMGLNPTCGIAPMINLKSLKISLIDFSAS